MRVYALVPARSGSKSIPDKNLQLLGGHSLMAHAIAFGRKLGVDRVLVSTDSERYRALALEYGAECPVLRSAEASNDAAMDEATLADLDRTLPGAGVELPDIWVWLKPTSPFRSVEAVRQGMAILATRSDIDSVRLVTRGEGRLQTIDGDGLLHPWTPGWDPTLSKIPRTQLPKLYWTYNVDIFRHAGWRARGAFYTGARSLAIVCPSITGLDINSHEDLELIRSLVDAQPRADIVTRHLAL